MNKSLVVGLTGSIGSGKSTVSALFAQKGYCIIDADVLARQAVEPDSPALKALVARFSSSILRTDGSLDRAALAAVAFTSEAATADLNAIVHPAVIHLLNEQLSAAKERGERVIVLDVPLLFQTGLDALCDETIAVAASPDTRLSRICARDGLTVDQAKVRMNAQPPDTYYTQHATNVVVNDGDMVSLQESVEVICDRIGG